jgi:hypothetical protein
LSITATTSLTSGGGLQQRLRWHLHELDPGLHVPLGALDRSIWLERLGRQLGRREQSTQVRIARELVGRCRTLTRTILEHDRELNARAATLAPRLLELPGCGPISAAKLLCEIGPIERFRTDAQLARHAGVAPLDASTGSRSPKPASTHPHAPTSNASRAKARAAAKPSAASNDNSPAPSTPPSDQSQH